MFFLFTDVEGSTRLWEHHPDLMRAALGRHDEIVRQVVDDFDAYVFSTAGDAFGIAFQSATAAVDAGVAIQSQLAEEAWAQEVPIRIRMGLNAGESHERDGDYFGPPVNRAARISSAAHGGQFVISDEIRIHLDRVGREIELIDLGEHRLKDLGAPEQIWQVPIPGVDGAHPDLNSLSRRLTNLPVQVTEFVGREADGSAVVDHLGQSRLVTIRGLGGMGKTRLSIQVGAEVLEDFDDGVWFVELAPAREPSAVPFAVVEALGFSSLGRTALEAVVDGIEDRRMLLILDNCEHVIEASRDLVASLLESCPNLHILATSRVALGHAGERVHFLSPLDSSSADSPAVTLFRQRAEAANPDLDFGPERMVVICDLVTQLDGIPLAVELAAARVRSLTPEEILDRLDSRFRLLASKDGTVERHRRLVDTIDWSYTHLADGEQLLFRRLAVFAGPFSLAAAEAVCADDELDDLDVLDFMQGLVDQSMVLVDLTGPTARYRLLESLREFGADQLGTDEALLARHTAYFATAVAAEAARSITVDEERGRVAVDTMWGDLRSAWFRSHSAGDTASACALSGHIALELLWRSRLEPSQWAQATIDMDDFDAQPPIERLGAFFVAAAGLMHGVENERAIAYIHRGVALIDDIATEDLDHRLVHGTSVMFFTGQLREGIEAIGGLLERLGGVADEHSRLLAAALQISQSSMCGYSGLGERARSLAIDALDRSLPLGPTWETLGRWDVDRYGDDVDPGPLMEALPGYIEQFASVQNHFLGATAERHLVGLRAQNAELGEHLADTASQLESIDVTDPRVPTGWLLTAAIGLLKARSWFDAAVLLEWQDRYRVAPILPDRQAELDELVPLMDASIDDELRARAAERIDSMDLSATVRFAVEALTLARASLAGVEVPSAER